MTRNCSTECHFPTETEIYPFYLNSVWQWTFLRPQEMMIQNVTVSADRVTECPANRELHSPIKCILKREKYNIAASDKSKG